MLRTELAVATNGLKAVRVTVTHGDHATKRWRPSRPTAPERSIISPDEQPKRLVKGTAKARRTLDAGPFILRKNRTQVVHFLERAI
jgi:hypothetical protein